MENRKQLDTTIGEKLKAIRIALNETQQETASRIELSSSFVGFIELGKRLPSVEVLKKYAEVYSLDYFELLKLRKDTIFETYEMLGDDTPVFILNEYVMLNHYVDYTNI